MENKFDGDSRALPEFNRESESRGLGLSSILEGQRLESDEAGTG
jgi:hypothetical protein